jgi:hypothetical protein
VAGWGGIYSHQPNCSRWRSLLAMGAPDSVRCVATSACSSGLELVDRWRLCPHVAPDSPVPLWLAALTSEIHCSLCRVDRCTQIAVAPLVHRTGRWIIAEVRLENPKVKSLKSFFPGAPDTVRWHTGQSGASDQGARRFPFAPFFWTLACSFYWFVLNLWYL